MSPLNIHRESSNNFNLFRDSNITKVGSGLFLNEIEPMNSIKFEQNYNLKEGVEFFFDRRNSSSDILKTRSNQKKSDNDDDDNSYVINSNRNNNPLKLNKVNRSFGKNNHLKNDEFNEYSIFQKSSNKNKKKSIYWICTKCLNKNKDNFCPHCGTKKPQ
jgi:rubrerythrin